MGVDFTKNDILLLDVVLSKTDTEIQKNQFFYCVNNNHVNMIYHNDCD